MARNPKISIILPVFNAVKYIEQSINSIINQSYKNIECIVIDGLSTDGTIDILKKYSDKISYISEMDNGIFDAMNKGITHSSGSWVIFLGADDRLEPCAVESLVTFTEEFDIIYGNTYLVFTSGKEKKQFSRNYCELRKSMIASHQSIMMKKEAIVNLGGFDITYRYAADYDLILRAYLNCYSFKKTDYFISHFFLGGISSDNLQTEFEILQIHQKNKSLTYPVFHFIISFIKQLAVIFKHKYLD